VTATIVVSTAGHGTASFPAADTAHILPVDLVPGDELVGYGEPYIVHHAPYPFERVDGEKRLGVVTSCGIVTFPMPAAREHPMAEVRLPRPSDKAARS
jgi:hypothetical protein